MSVKNLLAKSALCFLVSLLAVPAASADGWADFDPATGNVSVGVSFNHPNNHGGYNQGGMQIAHTMGQYAAPMAQGFNPMAQGFNPMAQGFNPMAQGFNPMAQGFNPMGQGFAPPMGNMGGGSQYAATTRAMRASLPPTYLAPMSLSVTSGQGAMTTSITDMGSGAVSGAIGGAAAGVVDEPSGLTSFEPSILDATLNFN